jgi:ferredoxin-thioredoxin reductase catalytic chain
VDLQHRRDVHARNGNCSLGIVGAPTQWESFMAQQPKPSEKSTRKVERLVTNLRRKSGTFGSPIEGVSEAVIAGLASHLDGLGKPLCPCRFYPSKTEESKHRTWMCACDDMQVYKYCHCMLFVDEEGLPITEHLPPEHEGRRAYGLVRDPAPDRGRPLREKSAEREEERARRAS